MATDHGSSMGLLEQEDDTHINNTHIDKMAGQHSHLEKLRSGEVDRDELVCLEQLCIFFPSR
jgi:hypothetical protein